MRPGILLAAVSWSWVAPLGAQTVVLVGTVVDSTHGLPLEGASVEIVEQEIQASTNSAGQFLLEGVEGGVLTVMVRRLGYLPGGIALEMTVVSPATVDLGEIQMSPAVATLDPVVVEGERLDERLAEVGFTQRKQTEAGTFLTYEEITRQNPANTSELLRRVPGFRVFMGGYVSSARGIPSLSQGFDQCGVQYYIDGVHADGSDMDTVLPNAIAGMEVYTGSASIPPKFRVAGNPKCGVILIWTRSGGPVP